MIRVPRKTTRSMGENTIPLINVVFLMLVFFLVAGTITPPIDRNVEMVSLPTETTAPPPDMIFIREDGTLSWQGDVVEVGVILNLWKETQSNDKTIMRVVADHRLPAVKLLEILETLRAAEPDDLVLITEREVQ